MKHVLIDYGAISYMQITEMRLRTLLTAAANVARLCIIYVFLQSRVAQFDAHLMHCSSPLCNRAWPYACEPPVTSNSPLSFKSHLYLLTFLSRTCVSSIWIRTHMARSLRIHAYAAILPIIRTPPDKLHCGSICCCVEHCVKFPTWPPVSAVDHGLWEQRIPGEKVSAVHYFSAVPSHLGNDWGLAPNA